MIKQLGSTAMLTLFLAACTPKVQVALPSEPININLNVKIQHEIYIKVDKQLDELFSDDSGLF
ncbi:YnbE family lipoprotein [Rheinheimera maricola]|uniref:YnbE family lipoprotein n=1 Tax=Rheinheimera maricola TaxID=2793282 RepID=A0ABS7XEX1_9GAMM|nr:YnbE family lipoprotein [Rheinheimera maricola]MBZ9613605.1 YnbE family lipoprotein [Rheinheimera maricola]